MRTPSIPRARRAPNPWRAWGVLQSQGADVNASLNGTGSLGNE
jgi:hypothetical protein